MFQKFSDLKKAKALQKTFAEEKVEMEDQGLKVVINGNMKIEEIQLDPQLKAEEQAERLKTLINRAFLGVQQKIAAKIIKEKLF